MEEQHSRDLHRREEIDEQWERARKRTTYKLTLEIEVSVKGGERQQDLAMEAIAQVAHAACDSINVDPGYAKAKVIDYDYPDTSALEWEWDE